MKKIAIIGGGNMGMAFATGVSHSKDYQLAVSDSNEARIKELSALYKKFRFSTSNTEVARDADIVVLAVKPYLIDNVIDEIHTAMNPSQILISFARPSRHYTRDNDASRLKGLPKGLFVAIPTTSIAVREGITFISEENVRTTDHDTVKAIFDILGTTVFVDNEKQRAGTALCSCGIAYAFKYAQACVQAGVQLGFRPDDALRYVAQTVKGAMTMLQKEGAMPQQEIYRVTTPGGMTIKGVNELDHEGFTSAVIKAILRPLQ